MKSKLTLHIVGLPHTTVTKKLPFLPCAYTQKILNLCKMMKSLDHNVYLYAGGNYTDAPCDEFISIFNENEQEHYFGNKNDWLNGFFKIDWNPNDEYWVKFNTKVADEISKRKNKTDIVCIIGGVCQKLISDKLQDLIVCECGIGYTGVFSKYKVYESYSHMHYLAGQLNQNDGNFYDCVIPNYYDPDDFEFRYDKDDYYLFIGRLIKRKGAHIAAQVCEKLGKKLLVAGQGVVKTEPGKIIGNDITLVGDHIEHIGVLGVEERSKIMGGAKAVFVPTLYFGPFEGVSVEAMMCGTPIITTDFGCFTENNIHGQTGYRCNTFEEFIWAADNINDISPISCRKFATNNFSINKIRYMYEEYFYRLMNLWENGWYQENNNRIDLSYLYKDYLSY